MPRAAWLSGEGRPRQRFESAGGAARHHHRPSSNQEEVYACDGHARPLVPMAGRGRQHHWRRQERRWPHSHFVHGVAGRVLPSQPVSSAGVRPHSPQLWRQMTLGQRHRRCGTAASGLGTNVPYSDVALPPPNKTPSHANETSRKVDTSVQHTTLQSAGTERAHGSGDCKMQKKQHPNGATTTEETASRIRTDNPSSCNRVLYQLELLLHMCARYG